MGGVSSGGALSLNKMKLTLADEEDDFKRLNDDERGKSSGLHLSDQEMTGDN